jgi:formylglycine-generating enzyme required for sulfatase activity
MVMMALVLLFFAGCSGDDDPGIPEVGSGTVVMDPSPNDINAPWILAGPNSYSESDNGDVTLNDLTPGDYAVTWSAVSGWITPSSETQTLAADETLTFTGTYTDNSDPSVGFVLIMAGTFTMGSPAEEPGRRINEIQHTVTLTHDFYLSKYEVTGQLWDEVMGSGSSTSQLPKNTVSWDDAVAFCNTLSNAQGLTPVYTINSSNSGVTWNQSANGYRLPTEAEWEYACRAGSETAFANGPITELQCGLDPNLDAMGWYCGNAGGLEEVGQKAANAWGLFDMHGNLLEWVWDGYREDYENLTQADPVHNVELGDRVIRGGCENCDAQSCRSGYRDWFSQNSSDDIVGFRIVRSTN